MSYPLNNPYDPCPKYNLLKEQCLRLEEERRRVRDIRVLLPRSRRTPPPP